MYNSIEAILQDANKPQQFWNTVLLTDEAKCNLLQRDGKAKGWLKKY